ncbi:MAG: hypothetical protein M3R27_16770, partial [Bacteroidota bacterium]|nr:hypothetical protein [Bacteroidota bacterium]
MDKKLNILFISGWYPNRLMPTLGNFVQKHAEAVALHCNVAAVHACSDANCKGELEITGQMINNVFTVNVYYKKITHSIPILSQVQKLLAYKNAFKMGIEQVQKRFGKIDVVHHNILYPSGIIALHLKKKFRIPY